MHRAEMALFVQDILGLRRAQIGGVEADLYALPDGSHFAVADPHGMGDTDRSIGFRVRTSTTRSSSSERPELQSMIQPRTIGSVTFTSERPTGISTNLSRTADAQLLRLVGPTRALKARARVQHVDRFPVAAVLHVGSPRPIDAQECPPHKVVSPRRFRGNVLPMPT